jgi:HEAT repeat protein
MSLRSAATRWRKHWTRLEPGDRQLSALREEGNLKALCGYLDEPDATPALRRRVTLMIATMAPGGGDAGIFSGPTDPAIIPILAPLLEEDVDVGVRRSAAAGLSRTRDPGAADALLKALSSSDGATRVHGIFGLERLRWRPAVDSIARLLDDPKCRRCAAEALVQIGDGRAIRPLWTAAFAAEHPRVRKGLERAAGRLEEAAGFTVSR